MSADKNQNVLEKQLKTLGQEIRIKIIKILKNIQNPLSFSKLQKEVLEHKLSSVNLSFHINALKKTGLILSSDDGYSLTILGEQILDKILSIEEILNNQTKVKMIRTSKYSKELFDINKIEEYLVDEGELDHFLAKQIAHEVEDRISKINIEYLTTPLMREYINVILLENGLEEIRHKLTRLGCPPSQVLKLFNSKEKKNKPHNFIHKLGSEVSEQFLLLNLIPKNLADLYLSGEIALMHLNYWSLRPLSIYINTKSLINYIFQKFTTRSNKVDKIQDYTRLILDFIYSLNHLKQYCSEDLILGDFNNQFLSYFNLSKNKSYLLDLLITQILRLNNNDSFHSPHYSLDFRYNYLSTDDYNTQYEIDKEFLIQLNIPVNNYKNNPVSLSLIDYSKYSNSLSGNNSLSEIISKTNKNNIIFYNADDSNLLNSSIIKILNIKKNSLLLDKILLNLHMISLEAKQNDELFLELLQEKMYSIFQLFDYKVQLIKKKLNGLKEWIILNSQLFKELNGNLFENSLKSISFFGLNKAILNHCGIELDRTESSKNFTLKILTLMRDLIKERNSLENNTYLLSQPHSDKFLINPWSNRVNSEYEKLYYSAKIIRDSANLPLSKRVSLFKEFERIINGGTLFTEDLNRYSFSELQHHIFKSKINSFYFGKFD